MPTLRQRERGAGSESVLCCNFEKELGSQTRKGTLDEQAMRALSTLIAQFRRASFALGCPELLALRLQLRCPHTASSQNRGFGIYSRDKAAGGVRLHLDALGI